MVAGLEVELGEESGAMEFIQDLVDDQNEEGVLDGDGVQRTCGSRRITAKSCPPS
jgi:DNA-directed RNA polymerase subunit N (RpoN/RPB10)